MHPAHALALDGIQRIPVAQGKTRLDCIFFRFLFARLGRLRVYLLFGLCAMLLFVMAFLLTRVFSCDVLLELSMGMGESLGRGSREVSKSAAHAKSLFQFSTPDQPSSRHLKFQAIALPLIHSIHS